MGWDPFSASSWDDLGNDIKSGFTTAGDAIANTATTAGDAIANTATVELILGSK